MATMDPDTARRIEDELKHLNTILEVNRFIQAVNPIVSSDSSMKNWDIKIQFFSKPIWDLINHWKSPGEKTKKEYLEIMRNLVLDYILNFKVLPPIYAEFKLDKYYTAVLKGYGSLKFEEVEAIIIFEFDIKRNGES